MTYLLASAARATVGARSGQEDAYSVWPAEGQLKPSGDSGMLAVLADGMGGHRGGAVAGQTACATFTHAFSQAAVPVAQRLDMALHASNDAIADAVDKNAGLKGMGCTLIGAWLDDTGMRWTSVGDSLLLLYRFPDVIRLNEDHSLGSYLDEQARRNEITYDEARRNRHRNALRSALTGSQIDLVDLRQEPLELIAGDWILLASDGIASLEGDELADIVFRHRDGSPDDMAQALIAAVEAKQVPEQDNTTVVAIRVEGASETVASRPDSKQEEVTLRTRRIGVVSRRKGAPPPPYRPRSALDTVVAKGPRALLLAAAAAFVIAAALYVFGDWNRLGILKPLLGKQAPVERPDPASQRQPVQTSPSGPPAQTAPPPPPPPPAPAVPVPGSGSSPGITPGAPPRPPAGAVPAVPSQPAPAAPSESSPLRSPQNAPPQVRTEPPEAPAKRGPGTRRTAPPATTTEEPDSTLQPGPSGELVPGGGPSSPRSGIGSADGLPQGPRKPDKMISAPIATKDDLTKQGTQRR